MTTGSFQFDPPTLAAELKEDLDAFRQALDEVELARREAEKTLAVRDDLAVETADVLKGCRLILEGLFLLGNRPDLVLRLRRALRRRRRSTGPAEPPEVDTTPPEAEPTDPAPASGVGPESPSTP